MGEKTEVGPVQHFQRPDSPMFRQEIDLGLGRVLKLLEAAGSPHEYLAPKVVSTEEFAVLVFVKHFM